VTTTSLARSRALSSGPLRRSRRDSSRRVHDQRATRSHLYGEEPAREGVVATVHRNHLRVSLEPVTPAGSRMGAPGSE
jgi:hypothetical protein